MGLLSHLFFLHLFVLVCTANIELPIKQFKDGSKSSFIQAPYISIAQDETVKGIQEEISNSWPEGVITYYLDDNSYDMSIGAHIRTAMSVLEAAACIRFRNESIKPEGNISWIHITNPYKKRQCVHDPKSMNKGEIMLTLGYDCLEHKDLIHSLLHGIGFKDEITHPHRDKYIRILWDNIQPVHRHLYRIQSTHTSRSIVEYDPLSIMHFHDRAFSSNGKATIVPLEPGLVISPSESLSQLDKMRLHLYFGHECNKRKFSSLMETCKKSLKGEQPFEDDHDQDQEDLNSDKVVTDDSKENEKNHPYSDEKVEPLNKTDNENSDGNDEHTKNTENEEGNDTTDENNVTGDIKQDQEETENPEENIVSEDKKINQDVNKNPEKSVTAEEQDNSKQGDKSENTTSTPVTLIKGLLLVPNDASDLLPNIQKKGESGINLNYDSAEK